MAAKKLDPQLEAFLQRVALLNPPPLSALTPEQGRQAKNAASIVSAGPGENVARLENIEIPGPAGKIPLRIFVPEGQGPFPVLVYFHGGGFVVMNIDTHDSLCRALANRTPAVVMSVEYRLAPEHKFPAPVEDAFAATCWAAENAGRFNGDPGRLALGGDSAGGNLATVISLLARDRGGPTIGFQLLVYPWVDFSNIDRPSHRDYGEGLVFTMDACRWYRQHYLHNLEEALDWRVSPLLAPDLTGLPPALVLLADMDILVDEGEAYAARLSQAGVPVVLMRYHGLGHAFFNMSGVLDRAKEAVDHAAAAIRATFRQK